MTRVVVFGKRTLEDGIDTVFDITTEADCERVVAELSKQGYEVCSGIAREGIPELTSEQSATPHNSNLGRCHHCQKIFDVMRNSLTCPHLLRTEWSEGGMNGEKPIKLDIACPSCDGRGYLLPPMVSLDDSDHTCYRCCGRGTIPATESESRPPQ